MGDGFWGSRLAQRLCGGYISKGLGVGVWR